MYRRLIVLMLGRLRMTVDDAIEAYQQLAGKVFKDVKWTTSDSKFKATELEKAIKEIVKLNTGMEDSETRLLDDNTACKVYVSLLFCGTLLLTPELGSCVP